MSTPNPNCQKCFKTGLPIILALYAVAPKYNEELAALSHEYKKNQSNPNFKMQQGEKIPIISGKFKTPDIKLPQQAAAQYTLRLPRQGFIYLLNPKAAKQSRWRCYEITEHGLYREVSAKPGQLPGNPDDPLCKYKKDTVCDPENNLTTARMITIPHAEDAEFVWIGFSDERWGEEVMKAHENEKQRNKTMRKVNIKAWLASQEHEHAACVHGLPALPIAEYAEGAVNFEAAFSYSTAQFNFVLKAHARKILKEMGETSGMEEFDASNGKNFGKVYASTLEGIRSRLASKGYTAEDGRSFTANDLYLIRKHYKLGLAGTAKDRDTIMEKNSKDPSFIETYKNAKPLLDTIHINKESMRTVLCQLESKYHQTLENEMNLFYARGGENGKNSAYQNKAMILALNDPAGIAQDLDRLIVTRMEAVAKSPQHERTLSVNEKILTLKIMTKNMEDTLWYTEQRTYYERKESVAKGKERNAPSLGRSSPPPLTPEQKKQLEELKELKDQLDEEYELRKIGLSSQGNAAFEKKWKDEYAGKIDPDLQTERTQAYETAFKTHKENYITPLARAHRAWMESDQLFQYLDGIFASGDKAEDRKLCANYTRLISACVGSTCDQPECKELYVQWATDKKLTDKEQNKRALTWRGLNCNSDALCQATIKTADELKNLQKAAASDAKPDTNEQLRTWAKTAWDAVLNVATEHAKAVGSYSVAQLENDASIAQTAFDEAQKLTNKLDAQIKKINEALDEIELQHIHEQLRYKFAKDHVDDRIQHVNDRLGAKRGTLMQEIDASHAQLNATRETYKKNIATAQKKLAELQKIASESPANLLAWQLQAAHVEAGKLTGNPNAHYTFHVVHALDGTVGTNIHLKGSPTDFNLGMRSRFTRLKGMLTEFDKIDAAFLKAAAGGNFPKQLLCTNRVGLDSALIFEAVRPLGKTRGKALAKLTSGTLQIPADSVQGILWRFTQQEMELVKDIIDYNEKAAHMEKRNAELERQRVSLEEQIRNEDQKTRDMDKAATQNKDKATEIKFEKDKLARELRELEALAKKENVNVHAARKQLTRTSGFLYSERRIADHRARVGRGYERGMAGANMVFSTLALMAVYEQLDKIKATGDGTEEFHKEYENALQIYHGTCLAVIGAGAEISIRAVAKVGTLSGAKWAVGLQPFARFIAGKIVPFATAPLGTLEVILDFEKAGKAELKGDRVWMWAYRISAGFGLGSVFFGMFAVFAFWLTPIAIFFAIVYAILAIIIAIFEPNATQQWLDECYHGKHPLMEEDKERRAFNMLYPAQQAEAAI